MKVMTDKRLSEIREKVKVYWDGIGPDDVDPLLDRLEAAEKVCEAVDSEIADEFPSLEYRLGPWRMACGRSIPGRGEHGH